MKNLDPTKLYLGALTLALLAGCGGQDGSSPNNLAPKADVAGSSNAQAGANTTQTDAAQTDADTTGGTTPAAEEAGAASSSEAPPLSKQGVHGDVLATALRLSLSAADTPFTLQPFDLPPLSDYYANHPMHLLMRTENDAGRTGLGRYVHETRTYIPITRNSGETVNQDDQRFTFGMEPRKSRSDFREGIVLRLNDTARWERTQATDGSKDLQDITLKAESGVAIKRNQLYRDFQAPVIEWTFDDGQDRVVAQLKVEDLSPQDNSFATCIDVQIRNGSAQPWRERGSRSTCIHWKVPSNWQFSGREDLKPVDPAQTLTGRYFVQIRSFRPVWHGEPPYIVDYDIRRYGWRGPEEYMPGH